MDRFLPKEYRNIRSQQLPVRYMLNGAIYISKVDRLLEENSIIYDGNSFAFVMEKMVSVDIDSKKDIIEAYINMCEINDNE